MGSVENQGKPGSPGPTVTGGEDEPAGSFPAPMSGQGSEAALPRRQAGVAGTRAGRVGQPCARQRMGAGSEVRPTHPCGRYPAWPDEALRPSASRAPGEVAFGCHPLPSFCSPDASFSFIKCKRSTVIKLGAPRCFVPHV